MDVFVPFVFIQPVLSTSYIFITQSSTPIFILEDITITGVVHSLTTPTTKVVGFLGASTYVLLGSIG